MQRRSKTGQDTSPSPPLPDPTKSEEDVITVSSLLAETFLHYIYWSIFCGHIPAVWFGPMSILRATDYGEEFYYLVAYLSPLLLRWRRFREFLVGKYVWAQLLPLIGIPSLLMNTLRDRTLLVCAGTALGMALHWSTFWMGPQRRTQSTWAILLGLFAFTSSRFAFSTVIPLWLNTLTTWGSLLLGVVAVFVFGKSLQGTPLEYDKEVPTDSSTNIRLGVGFGSLVFMTHWILSSHGIFARWIDLDPFLVGLAVLGSMLLGIAFSQHPFTRSWRWWCFAVFSAPLLLSPGLYNVLAIVFGLIVITYTTSVWHIAVSDLAHHSRMTTSLTIAGLVYLFGNLAVIWSVAYCFVPPGTGGPFMRERSGQVFCLFVVLTGLAYYSPESKLTKEKLDKPKPSFPPKSVWTVLLIILLICTLPAIVKRGSNWHNRDGYPDMPTDHIRGMAWAIRFGYDNFGFPNFADLVTKIKEVKANTILLVETDTARPFNTNWDVVEYLEENLHLYSDYGPSTLNETWGCALFSYFPIVRSDREVLPSPEGENACLIDATLDVNGDLVDVIGVHFGNTEHVLDRELQADEVATRAKAKASAKRKTIWLGYLTDVPGGHNYKKITDAGLVDVSPMESKRYCIYLFHIGMQPKNFKRVDVGDITDTEIQIADFFIPK